MQQDAAFYDVLSVPISKLTINTACERIEEWAGDDIGRFVCIRDVASLMAIRDDAEMAPLHRDAEMIAPDGMPIVLIGRMRGHSVERVCGPDLMDEMMRRSAKDGLKHFFYGGKDGVAESLAHKFMARYAGLQVVGWECPPFRVLRPDEHEAALERIRKSGADVVWIGLSSPKQDVWMWRNYRRLPQTLIGVGAAFDFHTGQVRRAPKWMQKYCLEWAYRFSQEPKRLYRRYLFQAPRFVGLMLLSMVRGKA